MKPALPTAADLDLLPVHCRAAIPESYLDEMGHMNVMWYTHLFARASGALFEKLGLHAAYFQARQAGTFALETHVRYLVELRVGQAVHVRSRVVGRSSRTIHYLHFLIRDDGPVLSAIGEHVAAHIDMRVRRTAPFPQSIADAIDQLAQEHAKLTWEAPACGVMSSERRDRTRT
jgi:acyl-CoA thioester hydrolase